MTWEIKSNKIHRILISFQLSYTTLTSKKKVEASQNITFSNPTVCLLYVHYITLVFWSCVMCILWFVIMVCYVTSSVTCDQLCVSTHYNTLYSKMQQERRANFLFFSIVNQFLNLIVSWAFDVVRKSNACWNLEILLVHDFLVFVVSCPLCRGRLYVEPCVNGNII